MKNKRLFIILLAGIILVLAAVLTFFFLSRPSPAEMSATALAEAVNTAYPMTATAEAAWTPTPTPPPTATVTPTVTATADGPLLQDNFSKILSGWSINSFDEGSLGYADGKYQLTVISTKWDVWSYLGKSFVDAKISVDASVVASTGNGIFGVLCRLQDDDNFYALEVSEEGFFKIWKRVDGEDTALYDWENSDAIPIGVPLTIHAGCAGNQITLGVNDTVLATVQDDSFTKGKVGLIAGTDDTGNFSVAFDNFMVEKP
jgi:hypothetical protein